MSWNRNALRPGDIITGPSSRASYHVGDVIGRGGFGEVYRVERENDGARFAMKVLKLKRAKDQKTIERSQREAEVLFAMKHPNVVKVHDFGARSDGLLWMVMDLLEGWTLAELMQHVERMPVPWALEIATGMCAGLSAIHEHAIHRDIKPQNIHVSRDCKVRLLDLGASRVLKMKLLTTDKYKTLGTLPYMSPEQIQPDEDVELDQRSDLFSVGIVLYQLLSGFYPFFLDNDEGEPSALLYSIRIVSTPHVPLLKRAPWVPRSVANLVDRCLAKVPGDRMPSSRELAAVLTAELMVYRADNPLAMPMSALADRVPLSRPDEDAPDSEDPIEAHATDNPFAMSQPTPKVDTRRDSTHSPLPSGVAFASTAPDPKRPADGRELLVAKVDVVAPSPVATPAASSGRPTPPGLVLRARPAADARPVAVIEDAFLEGDHDERIPRAVGHGLVHAEPSVRAFTVKLCGAIGQKDLVAYALERVAGDPDPEVRRAASSAVEWSREPLPPPDALLFFEKVYANALRRASAPWVVQRAMDLLDYDAMSVRAASVEALANGGGLDAIARLEKRLQVEEFEAIKMRIRMALQLLKERHGPDLEDASTLVEPQKQEVGQAPARTRDQVGMSSRRARGQTMIRLAIGIVVGIALAVGAILLLRVLGIG